MIRHISAILISLTYTFTASASDYTTELSSLPLSHSEFVKLSFESQAKYLKQLRIIMNDLKTDSPINYFVNYEKDSNNPFFYDLFFSTLQPAFAAVASKEIKDKIEQILRQSDANNKKIETLISSGNQSSSNEISSLIETNQKLYIAAAINLDSIKTDSQTDALVRRMLIVKSYAEVLSASDYSPKSTSSFNEFLKAKNPNDRKKIAQNLNVDIKPILSDIPDLNVRLNFSLPATDTPPKKSDIKSSDSTSSPSASTKFSTNEPILPKAPKRAIAIKPADQPKTPIDNGAHDLITARLGTKSATSQTTEIANNPTQQTLTPSSKTTKPVTTLNENKDVLNKLLQISEAYACMNSGFIIKNPPCRAPQNLKDFYKINGVNSESFQCPNGKQICNPLLFGVKNEVCNFRSTELAESRKKCFEKVYPPGELVYCVRNGPNATQQCHDLSQDPQSIGNAAAIINLNPDAWEQYRNEFRKLCDEQFIDYKKLEENYKLNKRKFNQTYIKNDIKNTCAVAKKRITELNEKYALVMNSKSTQSPTSLEPLNKGRR